LLLLVLDASRPRLEQQVKSLPLFDGWRRKETHFSSTLLYTWNVDRVCADFYWTVLPGKKAFVSTNKLMPKTKKSFWKFWTKEK
jgi:hypothetical protein